MKKSTKGFIIGLTATAVIGGGVTAGILLGDDVKGTNEMDDLNKTIAVKANVDSFDLDRCEVFTTNYMGDVVRLCGIAQKGDKNSNANLFYMIDEEVAKGLRNYCVEHCGKYYRNEVVATDVIEDNKAMLALLNKVVERDVVAFIEGDKASVEELDVKFMITEYTKTTKNEDNTCTFSVKGIMCSKNDKYTSKRVLTELKITQPYEEAFEDDSFMPIENYLIGKEGVVIEFIGTKDLESVQEAAKTYSYDLER